MIGRLMFLDTERSVNVGINADCLNVEDSFGSNPPRLSWALLAREPERRCLGILQNSNLLRRQLGAVNAH